MDNNSKITRWNNKKEGSEIFLYQGEYELQPVYQKGVKNNKNVVRCNWDSLYTTIFDLLGESNVLSGDESISNEFTYMMVCSKELENYDTNIFLKGSSVYPGTNGLSVDTLSLTSDDSVVFTREYVGGDTELVNSDRVLEKGEWAVITVTRDDVATSLYVNTELVYQIPTGSVVNDNDVMSSLSIADFGGFIGDVFVFNKVLSEEERSKMFTFLDSKYRITAEPIVVSNFVPDAVSLSVSSISTDYICIEWDAVPNADEYVVIKNGTGFTTTTNTYYLDTNVETASTYEYTVYATNELGESRKNRLGIYIFSVESNVVIPPEVETYPDSYDLWIRPLDWLALPSIGTSEQKAVILFGVWDTSTNLISLSASGNYTVDWGDGTVENFNSGVVAEHDYSFSNVALNGTTTSEGFKQAIITITPQAGQNLTALNLARKPASYPTNGFVPMILDIDINATFLTSLILYSTAVELRRLQKITLRLNSLTSMASLFYNCTSLQSVTLNTTNCTNMNYMFRNCSALQFVNLFDTQNCLDMSYMFSGCSSLLSVPNFDARNVSNTSYMFNSCSSLHYIPEINFQSATNMSYMFYGCYSLRTVSLFNTQSAVDMSYMFNFCSALQYVPQLNTQSVTSMSYMFSGCTSLIKIEPFNVINVTNMGNMFNGCTSLLDVPLFTNTQNVTAMNGMLSGCTSLKTIPLLDTQNVTTMASMFDGCSSLESIPLLNTQNVTSMSSIFQNCKDLLFIPLLNTQNVTNMLSMFQSCSSLQTVPLFNTQNVTSMSNMFNGCTSLQTIPLLNTQNVTSMSNMFSGCTSLQTVPLFNTQNVASMTSMFSGCRSLQTVPLFNTQNVTGMSNMFNGCASLQTVPLFNTQNVTNMGSMFINCYSLQTIPLFNAYNTTELSSLFGNVATLRKATLIRTQRTITYSGLPLSKTDLLDIFTNLNKIGSSSQTITISSTIGATANPSTSRAGYNTTAGSNVITTTNTSGITTGMLITGTSVSGNSGSLTLTSGTNLITLNDHNIPNGTPIAFSVLSMTGTAVSFNATTDIIILNGHGLVEGDLIFFVTANNGLTAEFPYFVRNPTTDNFQISIDPTGPIVNITGTTANTMRRIGTFFPFYVINSSTNTFQVSRTIGGSAIPFSANGTGNLIIGNSLVTAVDPNVSITLATPAVATGTNQTLAFRDLNTSIATLKGWGVIG